MWLKISIFINPPLNDPSRGFGKGFSQCGISIRHWRDFRKGVSQSHPIVKAKLLRRALRIGNSVKNIVDKMDADRKNKAATACFNRSGADAQPGGLYGG
jgi:hypothetical protein